METAGATTIIIDKRKLVRWECLARYFSKHEGKLLDMVFDNPLCREEERVKILDNLDVTVEQKKFLLKIFDIDYIYIQNKKPMLIEEKTKNIEGEKFLEGNYIYLNHGTSTQYQHLKEAYDLGIEAGILLRCVKFKREPTGLLSYAFIANENIEFEDSKFYCIERCIHMEHQTKIAVDDFIRKMRNLSSS